MSSKAEIIEVQEVVREFGWEIHGRCRFAADALMSLGMYEEAASIIRKSGELIELLRNISGNDFLVTGNSERPVQTGS